MDRTKFEKLVTTNNAVPLTGGWMVFNDLEMFNLNTRKSVQYDSFEDLYQHNLGNETVGEYVDKTEELYFQFLGGRGASSGMKSNGANRSRNIDDMQAEVDGIKKRLGDIVHEHGSAIGLPREYYNLQRRRQDLQEQILTLRRQDDERLRKERDSQASDNRTFVNGYGEATDRYITTTSYERATRRNQREVESFLGVRRGRRRV